jgi:DNA polymerase III delta prime subunit
MALQIHKNIYEKLDYFYETNKIPHLLFHGASGSGKRTIVHQFLNKIYQGDHKKMKTNIMHVNCAHGKGIKFIREELKFFAKSNVQSNTGVLFKTIVLMNADNLTIDAQSALRRCIELFSSNTRFFIIVENKNKLLNPILSRFCEIYVPEYMENGKIMSLHQLFIKNTFSISENKTKLIKYVEDKMNDYLSINDNVYIAAVDLAVEFYENGISCLDILNWIELTDRIEIDKKSRIFMQFDEIKFEYRSEKLLMLCLFDFLNLC